MATAVGLRVSVRGWLETTRPVSLIVRHKAKMNVKTRKHRPMVIRALQAITEPLILEDLQKPICPKTKWARIRENEEEEVNLYQDFLVRKCKKHLENAGLILICQKLPMGMRDTKKIKLQLEAQGFKMPVISNTVMKRAIHDTRWIHLSPLLLNHNFYATSEDARLKELLGLIRKFPQLIPLAAVVDNTILNRADLLHYATLDLEVERTQLVTLLKMPGERIVQLLNNHPKELTCNIEQYIKQKGDENTSS
ncbi:39S ribosomal protein L10, mitochondrial [Lingula anatina]|uniref:Large ribosomal subunit protein uL10m n=1 Tax=Lingula anatina TaxID=7574 RepID=A0A1S3JR88_LINAN|nr:39S ribosomal protein L10, mitochondrial [Lingula anatina]|eukprot:XP_013412499.1 39S ribosomal protein L10, mitochondrial [Lingula anatina]